MKLTDQRTDIGEIIGSIQWSNKVDHTITTIA